MKSLTDTAFFRILQGDETNEAELQQEYERFAKLLYSEYNNASNDRAAYHNMLVYTMVELTCLQPVIKQIASHYLEKAIEFLDKYLALSEQQILAEQTGVDCPLKQKSKRLKWTTKILDYVEWIYGLHEILNLNGGKVALKTLFDFFNPIFGIKITQFSGYFNAIKNRKKGDRSTLFDKQKELLTQRMEDADNTPSKK
jgi:hypothetical protein